MKKIISVILIIICFVFVPMNVLAASPKKQLTNQTKKVLKACKNYDRNQLQKYIKSKDKFYYITDPTWNQWIKEGKKHDKVKISDIEFYKKEAYVTLDVKTIDYYEIFADCFYREMHQKGKFNTTRLNNDIIKRLKSANSKWKKDQSDYTLTLTFKKVKNTWMISEIGNEIETLYDGGAARCIHDFTENPFDFY